MRNMLNINGITGKALALCLLMYLPIYAFSQTESRWELLTEQQGVKIFTQKVQKPAPNGDFRIEYLLFRYQNTNKTAVTLTYKLELWYGESCRSCNVEYPSEYHLSISLKPGETLSGKPGDASKTHSLLSRQMVTGSQQKGITKVVYQNLMVTNQ